MSQESLGSLEPAGGPRLVSLQAVTQGCRSQTDVRLEQVDLESVVKSSAALLSFPTGERVSVCAGLLRPKGRVWGAWFPGLHQEPRDTGAPPGAVGVGRCRGRQEPGSQGPTGSPGRKLSEAALSAGTAGGQGAGTRQG